MGERRDEAIGKIFNVCPGGKQLLLMLCSVNQHSLNASNVDDHVKRPQQEYLMNVVTKIHCETGQRSYRDDTSVSMRVWGCENNGPTLSP